MGLEKILSKQVKKLKKDKNIVSIVQSGSSRREDFVQGLSDIDLLIIKKYAKSGLKIGCDGDIELNFIYRNKGDYICTTSPGNITFY